ncbi:MAG TPA: hypothetical protein VH438_17710, partial [Gemmatimonadales bacterium]
SLAGTLGEENGPHSAFPDPADQPIWADPLQRRRRSLIVIIKPADQPGAIMRSEQREDFSTEVGVALASQVQECAAV